MQFLLFIFPAVAGGFTQSVTGFGCGIVMMLFLPALMGVLPAATVCQCVSIFLCISMIIHYRKYASFKAIIWPLIFYFPVYLLLLNFAASMNVDILKPLLGVFLIIVSIYFTFAAGKITIKSSPFTAFICAGLGGMIDAFFGLGGPPVVIYFLNTTKSKEEYLGTIQAYFLITSIYGTCVRAAKGILTIELLPVIAIVGTSILLGVKIGNRFADRINGELLKKIVYIFIGIAGIITVATAG